MSLKIALIEDNIVRKELEINSIRHASHFGLNKLKRIYNEKQFCAANYKKYAQLTPRELEVMKLLYNGMNNPAIARTLFISRFTVEQHRKNINRKLELRSFSDLVKYALAFDLV